MSIWRNHPEFAPRKTYMKFWEIPASIRAKQCGWTHVERAKA